MDLIHAFTLVIVLSAIIGFFSWLLLITLRDFQQPETAPIRSALEDMPRTAVRDAKTGALVKLVGRVRLTKKPLKAPLTGRACAFYEVTVQERISSGSGRYRRHHWVQLIHERKVVSFHVEDDTGRAFVRGRDFFVRGRDLMETLDDDFDLGSGALYDPTPQFEAFLQKHGQTGTGLLFNKTLRYREAVVAPGELVAVTARARLKRDPDPSGAGSGDHDGPQRVVLDPPIQGCVIASNKPSTRQ